MRRKDREVQNKTEVFDILNRCDTIRIGMQGNQYPYVAFRYSLLNYLLENQN